MSDLLVEPVRGVADTIFKLKAKGAIDAVIADDAVMPWMPNLKPKMNLCRC